MNIWSSNLLEDTLDCGTPFWDLPDWQPEPVKSDRPAPPAPKKLQ